MPSLKVKGSDCDALEKAFLKKKRASDIYVCVSLCVGGWFVCMCVDLAILMLFDQI